MIEHGIPMPAPHIDRGEMATMQVGDSIVVKRSAVRAIRQAMFRLKWRVSMRKIDNDSYRLWRTR